MPIHRSLVQISVSSLYRWWHIGGDYPPDFKLIVPAIPKMWAFKKLLILKFFFIFFSHTCKNCQKTQTRNQTAFNLAHINWDITGTKYKQNWQSYKKFFSKKDTNMLSHLQGK